MGSKSLRFAVLGPSNNSLEVTWDAPRFACGSLVLISWKARLLKAQALQLEAIRRGGVDAVLSVESGEFSLLGARHGHR